MPSMYGGLTPRIIHYAQGEFDVKKKDQRGYQMAIMPIVLGRKHTNVPDDRTPEAGDVQNTEVVKRLACQVGNKIGRMHVNLMLWAEDPTAVVQAYAGRMWGAFDSARMMQATNYLNPDIDINYLHRVREDFTTAEKQQLKLEDNADIGILDSQDGPEGNDGGAETVPDSADAATKAQKRSVDGDFKDLAPLMDGSLAGVGDTVYGNLQAQATSGESYNTREGLPDDNPVLYTHFQNGIMDIRVDPQKSKWYSARRFLRFFQGRPVELRSRMIPSAVRRINPGTFFHYYVLNQSATSDIKVQYEIQYEEYWMIEASG